MKRMKELLKLQVGGLLGKALLTLALVFSLSLFAENLSIVSHAESAGRVSSASGANVRSSASASASLLTSWAQNQTVSIRSQIQAADGYTWYEVWVDERLGYVRSDLIEITDGSTPPSSEAVPPTTQAPDPGTGAAGGSSDVTAVNPVSATVINGGTSGVRIRSSASTTSGQIVTTVQNGLVLTVTGQATASDGVWYQVNFSTESNEITGFIRSDFVQLSEELTPYTEPEADPEQSDPTVENTPQPQQTKDYDTVYQEGQWLLVLNNVDPPGAYEIESLLTMVGGNQEAFDEQQKTISTQKIVIVILVILLVAAVGGVGFLAFKIKDMEDSSYFNEVENETLRRRNGQGGQRLMHNVGAEKQGTAQGQRPVGQRPAGSSQGQRPAGQRPAGAQGQRPVPPQGQRPAGASQGQRPVGQRPAGASQGQKPVPPQGQRPAGTSQDQRSAAPQGQRPAEAAQNTSRPRPKNFMEEEDEFEFGFLNYEDDKE